MKYLITGVAGFIGSNYIHYATKKYKEDIFYGIDALTYAGNYNNIKDLENVDNFIFINGDITDRKLIYNLFLKYHFDIVINFAAESHVDNSLLNPELFLKTNIIGTSVLLDACHIYGIKRYHQVSTDEVYGDLPLNKKLLFKEEMPLHPSSPYSSSKAAADLLCLSYYRTFNVPITISRCSNNYGPYQLKEKLIPMVIDKALNNQSIPVYGIGVNVRDWIYVMDHVKGIDLIVSSGKIGEVYNLGSNNEMSNIEIIKLILDKMKKSYDLIKYVPDRLGHDLRYAIDYSKINKSLNWKPTYDFDEYITKTIDWYIDNQDWLNKN